MKIYQFDKENKLQLISASDFTKNLSSNTPQFSATPTELNEMFEDFASLLDTLAVGVASIATASRELEDLSNNPTRFAASVTSRTGFVSSKSDDIMNRVGTVNDQINLIQNKIENGALMKRNVFEVSRNTVDRSSVFVEGEINDAKSLISEGTPYKEAYYEMTKVTIEFVRLVHKFNKAIITYNKLHNTNLTGARTDLSFFRHKADVLKNK